MILSVKTTKNSYGSIYDHYSIRFNWYCAKMTVTFVLFNLYCKHQCRSHSMTRVLQLSTCHLIAYNSRKYGQYIYITQEPLAVIDCVIGARKVYMYEIWQYNCYINAQCWKYLIYVRWRHFTYLVFLKKLSVDTYFISELLFILPAFRGLIMVFLNVKLRMARSFPLNGWPLRHLLLWYLHEYSVYSVEFNQNFHKSLS